MSVYQNDVPGRNSEATSTADSPSQSTAAVAATTGSPRPRFIYKAGWAERVPQILERLPRWVLWSFVPREKDDGARKWTKVPFRARDPRQTASATDPATWASFEEALATFVANPGEIDGLGFVLGRGDGPVSRTISGIDLDNCIGDDGRVAEWARVRIEDMRSYSEISPSGRGVKIFVEGCWADGKSYAVLDGLGDDGNGQIEIARRDRFFTVTGERVDDRWPDLAPGGAHLDALHGWIARENARRKGGRWPTGSDPAAGRPLPREDLAGLSPLQKFLAQLSAMGVPVARGESGYSACCPVHDDRNPSMSFRADERGRLLLHCFGCEADYGEIMTAVGLLPSDVHPDRAAAARARAEASRARAEAGVRVSRPVSSYTEAPDDLVAGMSEKACDYMEALEARPEKLALLAARLGVAEAALKRIGVGWKAENWWKDAAGEWVDRGGCWTFPEYDGRYEIVGLQRRFEDPALGKRAVGGGRRGLTVPEDWEEIPGPVHIVEGESDVAALLTAGLCAIGRPSARGGAGELAQFLRGVDRPVIVLGENDRKPDGRWPGKEGAFAVAAALQRALGREVRVAFPPEGLKDVREWIGSRRGEVKED